MATNTYIKFGLFDVTAKEDSAPTAQDTQPFINMDDLLLDELQTDKYATLEQDLFLLTNPTARGVSVFYSNRRQGSQGLAKALCDTVAALMNTPARGAMTRLYGGAYPQADYYGVIRGAVGFNGERSPKAAFLIEHGFHTNPQDCAWLMQEDNLKRLAAAETKVIAEYYGLSAIQEPPSDAEDWKSKYETLCAALDELIRKHAG